MNVDSTILAVKKFCKANSGDEQIWSGNKSTYHWNIGKITSQGIMNGVVRKLAGITATGEQIWVVAGSFKIMPDGTIARFTGLPKKFQTGLDLATETVTVPSTSDVTVTA
jgi:hypothetical protein